MIRLCAVFTFLLCVSAYAQSMTDMDWVWGVTFGKAEERIKPPAQYDHPYRGRLHTYYVNSNQLAIECMTGGRTIGGCAKHYRKGGPCSIYINTDFSTSYQEAVRRHEIAHCNGWQKDHRR